MGKIIDCLNLKSHRRLHFKPPKPRTMNREEEYHKLYRIRFEITRTS
jgi:hypothetical protein